MKRITKKILTLLILVVLLSSGFASCKKDEPVTDEKLREEIARLKNQVTLTFNVRNDRPGYSGRYVIRLYKDGELIKEEYTRSFVVFKLPTGYYEYTYLQLDGYTFKASSGRKIIYISKKEADDFRVNIPE